ncbi:hypothetical protein C6497_04835 [Candidatus Poribacteria bacterium]|nr:MAG: hypothetical protein C6497_04835 [Candidatus Poribacteria bacterium]
MSHITWTIYTYGIHFGFPLCIVLIEKLDEHKTKIGVHEKHADMGFKTIDDAIGRLEEFLSC